MPPPKPAREFAGHALGPTFSSAAAVHVPVPRRSSVTPAGPYTSTCVIGDGTGRSVEPIVALPNTFAGTPSRSGVNPAEVIFTVSWPRAAPAHVVASTAAVHSVQTTWTTAVLPTSRISRPFDRPRAGFRPPARRAAYAQLNRPDSASAPHATATPPCLQRGPGGQLRLARSSSRSGTVTRRRLGTPAGGRTRMVDAI